MTIINKYNDPLIFNWERDSQGNRISVPVVGEEHYIGDGKIVLEGLPDIEYGVEIKDYHEVFSKDLLKGNAFFVDYRNTGIVYFDPKRAGTVRVSYYSRGMNYYPASRVWTKANKDGSVQETLDKTLEGIDNTVEDINKRAEEIIREINEIGDTNKEELDIQIKEIEDNVNSIKNDIEEVYNSLNIIEEDTKEIEEKLIYVEYEVNRVLKIVDDKLKELGDLEDLAADTTNQLEGAIRSAERTKSDLIEVKTNAEDTSDRLFSRVLYAETVNFELSNAIDETLELMDELNLKINELEDVLSSISSTVDDAVEKEQKLKDTINEGEEVEQGIVITIDKGKETKDSLDLTIEEGRDLLNDLEGVIELEGLSEKEVLKLIEENVNDIKIYKTSQEASEKAKVGQIYFIEGDTEPRVKTGDNTSTGLATEQSVLVVLSTVKSLANEVDKWSDQTNKNADAVNNNFDVLFDYLENETKYRSAPGGSIEGGDSIILPPPSDDYGWRER